ncbi:hypothetical protein [Colwellia echini]|uniref:Uncharacterized protein n=1 Tax=Colwellia echini TaxID=1982103 RepID=A0ABY3N1A9_9GAMM|nr:hypothetical protein [Colwellia echini]TYK67276.1 hypothetical protein CWS31_001770 [Colwellia echini]
MIIEQFIDEKIQQLHAYVNAVIAEEIHYTELDNFILDTMADWTLLKVMDETPHSAKERVFWHLMHEVSLHGALALNQDLYFKSEMTTCLDFFNGSGSYPIDCIGWRPIA